MALLLICNVKILERRDIHYRSCLRSHQPLIRLTETKSVTPGSCRPWCRPTITARSIGMPAADKDFRWPFHWCPRITRHDTMLRSLYHCSLCQQKNKRPRHILQPAQLIKTRTRRMQIPGLKTAGGFCGLRRRTCVSICVVIAVLIVIAVVLGALLGTQIQSSKTDSQVPTGLGNRRKAPTDSTQRPIILIDRS